MEGAEAIVTVTVHFTVGSGDKTRRSESSFRDRWVRAGDTWLWKESTSAGETLKMPVTDPETARPVIAELKTRAIPLASVEPGTSDDDLAAFGAAVGDARIVALGEATHGTREFFALKQRLIEYLVRRKGFTVVSFEANWPESLPVDRYLKAPGDPEQPRGSGVDSLMLWMRAWNRAGAAPQLTWSGFDMQSVGPAADFVLEFLRRYAPKFARSAADAYQPARAIDGDHSNVFLPEAREDARRAGEVLAAFDAHRAEWQGASSAAEFRDARHAAATVAAACAMRDEANGLGYRDEKMARNVEWLADEAHPGEKIIVWAHNMHVAADGDTGYPRLGGWLRRRFGRQFYSVGFAFRRGDVWATGVEDGHSKGEDAWPVPPSPEGSGDAILSAIGMPLFFLDLRPVPRSGPLGAWLAEPHLFHSAGGIVVVGGPNLAERSLSEAFDGLVFVETSHASHAR
jgi:erythromycin esterase